MSSLIKAKKTTTKKQGNYNQNRPTLLVSLKTKSNILHSYDPGQKCCCLCCFYGFYSAWSSELCRKMKVTNAKKREVPFSFSYFAAPIKCFLLAPTHPSVHSLDYQANRVNSGHSSRRDELISHQRPQMCTCWLCLPLTGLSCYFWLVACISMLPLALQRGKNVMFNYVNIDIISEWILVNYSQRSA